MVTSLKKTILRIDEGKKRIGKDEMNLIELPFTLLSSRNSKGLRTIERTWTGKGDNNKVQEFYKIITGSDKWGLPTFVGEEVYLACMELSHRQGFQSQKIHTTQYELVKLLGWPVNNGNSYKRLINALNQLGGIWITTNAFWDNLEKKYVKKGFGIIQGYSFLEEIKGRKSIQQSSPLSYFLWNEIFFNESLKKGNIKTLDISLYFSLRTPTSKRLYRFADKKLYKQNTFEIDLFRLGFEKLEMTGNYKYPSKVIEKLQPAIVELRERNIVDIQIKESKTESGYKVCFKRIIAQQIPVEREISIKLKEEPSDNSTALLNYFLKLIKSTRKGNKKELKQSEILICEYGEEESRLIVDYAVREAQKTNFQIRYFGAVLNYVDEAVSFFSVKEESREQESIKNECPTPSESVSEDIQSNWDCALQTIQSEIEAVKFDTWLSGLVLVDYLEESFIVFDAYAKNNGAVRNKLESKYFPKLEDLTGKRIRFCED